MANQDEEYRLIIASKNGDTDALTKLIQSHSESVHSVIYSILGHRDIVEDLAQETFLRMISAIESYEFKAPFRAWLIRIAVNLCRDYMRRKKVRRIVTGFQKADEPDVERQFIDKSQNPVQDLIVKERMEYLQNALLKLPSSLKIVFVLRDIQDFSYDEIARTLNWRLGTVKSRLFRARKELARILSPYREDME